MEAETKLKTLRKKIRDGQMNQVRTQEMIRSLQSRRQDLYKKLQDKGVDPDNLDAEVAQKKHDLENLIENIEKLLQTPGKQDNNDNLIQQNMTDDLFD